VLVANHFDRQLVVDENVAVPAFVRHMSRGGDPSGSVARWEGVPYDDGGSEQDTKKGMRNARKRKRVSDGKMVCAQVAPPGTEVSWILARVLRYNPGKKMYTVEDVDNEADNDDDKNHEVHRNVCLPLPEEDSPAIPKSTIVLSVYPGTTSFYRGIITSLKKNGQYGIKFDDDNDEQGRPVKERTINRMDVVKHPTVNADGS
jgi:hypothetical protein